MRDTSNRRSVGSSRDEVGGPLHWPQTGDGDSVGGAAPYIRSLHKGEGL